MTHLSAEPSDLDVGSAKTAATDVPPRPSTLRRYLTISWVASIVAFTIARLVLAKETLEQYGLNIWVFGVIDLVTAVPYAIGVAKLAGALVDRDKSAAGGWALVAAVCFLAPYGYVAWAGREATFPSTVWVVLGILLVGFGGNAAWGVARRVRQARAARIVARRR